MTNTEFEQKLSKSMDPDIARNILDDPQTCLKLQEEYN